MKIRADHARHVIRETIVRNSTVDSAEAQYLTDEIVAALALRCAFKKEENA